MIFQAIQGGNLSGMNGELDQNSKILYACVKFSSSLSLPLSIYIKINIRKKPVDRKTLWELFWGGVHSAWEHTQEKPALCKQGSGTFCINVLSWLRTCNLCLSLGFHFQECLPFCNKLYLYHFIFFFKTHVLPPLQLLSYSPYVLSTSCPLLFFLNSSPSSIVVANICMGIYISCMGIYNPCIGDGQHSRGQTPLKKANSPSSSSHQLSIPP